MILLFTKSPIYSNLRFYMSSHDHQHTLCSAWQRFVYQLFSLCVRVRARETIGVSWRKGWHAPLDNWTLCWRVDLWVDRKGLTFPAEKVERREHLHVVGPIPRCGMCRARSCNRTECYNICENKSLLCFLHLTSQSWFVGDSAKGGTISAKQSHVRWIVCSCSVIRPFSGFYLLLPKDKTINNSVPVVCVK